jgi:hypothetical protein
MGGCFSDNSIPPAQTKTTVLHFDHDELISEKTGEDMFTHYDIIEEIGEGNLWNF